MQILLGLEPPTFRVPVIYCRLSTRLQYGVCSLDFKVVVLSCTCVPVGVALFAHAGVSLQDLQFGTGQPQWDVLSNDSAISGITELQSSSVSSVDICKRQDAETARPPGDTSDRKGEVPLVNEIHSESQLLASVEKLEPLGPDAIGAECCGGANRKPKGQSDGGRRAEPTRCTECPPKRNPDRQPRIPTPAVRAQRGRGGEGFAQCTGERHFQPMGRPALHLYLDRQGRAHKSCHHESFRSARLVNIS